MELDTEISQESLLEASEEDELEEAERTEAPPLPVSVSQELYLREMNQKGEGMTALKKSLSMFSDPSPLSHEDLSTSNATSPKRGEQYHTARQLRLERDAFESATERWRKEQEALQKHNVASDRQLNTLHARLFHWQQKLAQRLKEELLLCDIADSKQEALTPTEYQRREYGPFLRLVNPDQLAALTILTVFQNFSKIGVSELMKLSNVLVNVSRAVEAESVAEALSKSLKQNYGKKYLNRLITRSINRLSMKGLLSKARVDVDRMKERFEHYDRRFAAANLQAWPASIHAKVGAALCSHLFETATVTIYKEDPSTGKQLSNVQAVFRKITKYDKGRRRTLVQLHPVMVEKLAKEPPISLLAKQVPMITKPRPWTSFLEGGYLTTPTGFLRVKDSELDQRKYAEAAIERGDLEGYFTGLNILGETGWKVNADVFQVMREAWNTGQAIANLAPENPPIEMPPRPADGDMLGYRQWAHEVTKLENKRSGFHSERCFQNFQMEIARALLNETFYLPHNIDFRGRAYPIPPYFHQMCADHCRGLLLFAKGKELGVHGLRWLKIHLANVYGYDKASLAEREAFADRHLDEIRDSTDHPLDGRRWWLDAEDPWQCLATSFELRKALDSPDPTKYVSHIPVHQDGSCNGLQHYAALGGDIEGAQQVNLEPGDRPSDVYSGVAELVKAEISQDMEEGVEYAKILNGKVTRKVVKQTVMTNVYGVTFMGAMKQVRSQIEDLYPELEGKALQYSAYIAKKIFRALGTLFSGAHNIQFWLGDCANRINSSLTQDQLEGLSKRYRFDEVERDGRASKLTTREAAALMKLSFRCSVTWTTPLKLPVVQPYRDAKPKRVFTRLQTVMISAPTLQDNVHKRRQLQAFPPNFIHSLDATHMMLSAVKCNEMGMTFSAVHDSFWTHAADVDQMNRLLRDEFIRMHSENVIGRLAAEFKARYGNNIYRATIPGGTDLAEKILKWKTDYAATLGLKIRGAEFKVVEILIEHKRQKLLRSSDPQDQKEGAAMETAASIFEAEGHGDASLLVKSSLGQVNLGHVPKVTSKQTLKTALTKTEDMAEDVDLARSILPGTVDDPELLDDELICDLKQTINTSSSAMNGGKETRGRKPKKTTEQQTEQQAEQMEQKTEQKAKNKGGKRIHIWLPLRIPDIPQRVCFPSRLF